MTVKVLVMFAAGIIVFRETLEAVLVISVILTFLSKTNKGYFKRFIWYGIGVGLSFSLFLAFFLTLFFGGFTGKAEQFFEGILMFVTSGFLTWMILWVHRQKDIAINLKKKVSRHVDKGYGLGISALVASSVFREGTETVLYLRASSLTGVSNQLQGSIIGIIAALLLGLLIFSWAMRVHLKTIFAATSAFLLLFAAGLITHGIHEFQELQFLPIFSFDPIFNISHMLDNKSLFGSILGTLFGYTSEPTILELTAYGSYIIFIIWLQRFTDKLLYKKLN